MYIDCMVKQRSEYESERDQYTIRIYIDITSLSTKRVDKDASKYSASSVLICRIFSCYLTILRAKPSCD